jgi:hypothetical protein
MIGVVFRRGVVCYLVEMTVADEPGFGDGCKCKGLA